MPDKHKVFIQKNTFTSTQKNIEINVLRLDVMSAIISGNKFFKLQLPIATALAEGYGTVATFGGAYSNHIVATAGYCKLKGLKSIGFIRGEEPAIWSKTMKDAQELGMEFRFVTRAVYKDKAAIQKTWQHEQYYWVNEGGYGKLGAEGVKDMYEWIDESYTHIMCALGTGTMMAGLIKGALPHQKVIGISVLKGHGTLQDQVKGLLTESEKLKQYYLVQGYHFGGYAKHPERLINWMNKLYEHQQLPSDIVYTSKLFFAVEDLLQKGYFEAGSKIMVIHSGGLQGNSSLAEGVLQF
ncbi:1-aminocyclopropane-1-carboxylate deaminase/D-cysteine desulfhydrase [Parasediminibacterium sp. JCM 36343]|uniref:1-aminocyclopropane-1-carboxylate deaminase/D-cysteine desulfhydrase n=1 Tax=Parasediminibacterium sp. JCM 36343 TaxID=3374279 RepID=UPI00397A3448